MRSPTAVTRSSTAAATEPPKADRLPRGGASNNCALAAGSAEVMLATSPAIPSPTAVIGRASRVSGRVEVDAHGQRPRAEPAHEEAEDDGVQTAHASKLRGHPVNAGERIVVGEDVRGSLQPGAADLHAHARVRFDVAHIACAAAVLGDEPERGADQAV